MRGLSAIETLASGAIGGFAVLAAMDARGAIHYAQTQDGGSRALVLDAAWRDAQHAALISSGPHRPEPLVQFLPAAQGVGMVTGHRLPNRPGPGGPLNRVALEKMRQGVGVAAAVRSVLDAAPECDAGLMALNAQGEIAFANSRRVCRRRDLFALHCQGGASRFVLMMNSIYFPSYLQQDLAAILGAIALGEAAEPPQRTARQWQLPAGCPLHQGAADEVRVDAATGQVVAVTSADPNIAAASGRWVVIAHATPVRSLAGAPCGIALHDVLARVDGQKIHPLPGPAGSAREAASIALFAGVLP